MLSVADKGASVHEHLVAYEYGSGAVWGVVHATSPEQVSAALPEVAVHTSPPEWMTEQHLEALRRHSIIELANGEGLDHLFECHKALMLDLAS